MEYITWNWAHHLLKNLFVTGMLICERTGTTRKITSLCLQFTYMEVQYFFINNGNNKTPWPWSASELYRQSGRRRSANLVPTFADRGVSRGQRNGSPRPLISVFWTGAATFYSSSSSIDLTRLSRPRSRPTTTQKIW